MRNSDIFSIRRCWLLIKNDTLANLRSWLVVMAAMALLVVFFSLFEKHVEMGYYNSWYMAFLCLGGITFTSGVFKDMHQEALCENYLLTPASALEKTSAKLAQSVVGFPLVLMVFMTLVSLIVLVGKSFSQDFSVMFNPFQMGLIKWVLGYVFWSSFFFLGAAWFKKNNMAKTIVVLLVIAIVLFCCGWASSHIEGVSGFMNLKINSSSSLSMNESPQLLVVKLMFNVLSVTLPVCCWGIAWQRVKEAQVKRGI